MVDEISPSAAARRSPQGERGLKSAYLWPETIMLWVALRKESVD